MKCIHCGGEHTDNYKFCPLTGSKMEQTLKSCTNPNCVDFNKYVLPSEAMFCPKCGEKIDNPTYRYVSNNDLDCLRVVCGVKLGETLVHEIGVEKQGITLFRNLWGNIWIYEPLEGVSIHSDENDVFVSAEFHTIPKEWEMLGIDFNTNPDDLKFILSKWKFEYFPIENYDFELYEVLKQNNEEWCNFLAPSGNYKLTFEYENGTIVRIQMFMRDWDVNISFGKVPRA